MVRKSVGLPCLLWVALVLNEPMSAQAPVPTVQQAGSSLCGVVRSDGSLEPLEAARVELIDASRVTRTDARGEYCLPLTGGSHRLLISRYGYAPQAIVVVAGDARVIALDVTLVAQAMPLEDVHVRAIADRRSERVEPSLPWTAEPGERRLAPHDDPALRDADPLSAVTSTADGAGSGPEPGASLRVRGGSPDQNLVLLDGVPLYQPYHLTGDMSVLSPDAVTDGRLHAAVPTARLGGGLSSAVELRSRDPVSPGWASAGGISGGLARLSLSGNSPSRRLSFVAGGRTSARGIPGFTGDASNTTIGLSDAFARLRAPLGGGVVEFLGLSSADRLGFASTVDQGGANLTPSGEAVTPAALSTMAPLPPRDRFERVASTMALVWMSDTTARPRAGARLWHTTSTTAGGWLGASGPVALEHALASLGASADVRWRVRDGDVVVGFEAARMRTQYRVTRLSNVSGATDVPSGTPMLAFDVARLLASPFVEARWRLAERWALSVGLREQVADGAHAGAEPRLALRFRAAPWLSLAAAAGRLHQPLQALDNHESIFSTFLGGALPVLLDGPMARADRVDLGASVDLGSRAAFTIDVYANRFDALAQVAPASAQPFAVDAISGASGRSSGVLLGVNYADERLRAHAAYSYVVGERTADGVRYPPATGDTHTFSAAIGYRPWTNTRVRAALFAGAGRRTTVTAGDLEWAPTPLVSGEDVAAGPQRWLGALGGATLPAYVRVDVGLSHRWAVRVGSRTIGLTGRADLLNALGRDDARAEFVPSAGGASRFALMLPRTVTLGLDWAY